MCYKPWWQQAIYQLPFSVVCFHKWSKRLYVLAMRVVPINLSKCRFAGSRGRMWPRRWDMGMEKQLNRRT